MDMKPSNGAAAELPKMYETENDITQARRIQLNALLSQRLACAVDLPMQMKQAHGNVKGPSFKWLWFVEAHSQAAR